MPVVVYSDGECVKRVNDCVMFTWPGFEARNGACCVWCITARRCWAQVLGRPVLARSPEVGLALSSVSRGLI